MSRARDAGFTLLELLVSMTLLGFVFMLLFGGLRFGSRAWEKSDSETDATDTVRLAQSLLRGEIERACPRRVASDDPSAPPRVRFSGSDDDLSFLAPAPAASGLSGCARLALSVEPDGRQKRLVLTVGADNSASDDEAQQTDLIRHAQRIDLAYLAPGAGWRSGWSEQSDLPAAVRVRVAFAGGDSRQWPELIVAPRISAEADCIYDSNTQTCQNP